MKWKTVTNSELKKTTEILKYSNAEIGKVRENPFLQENKLKWKNFSKIHPRVNRQLFVKSFPCKIVFLHRFSHHWIRNRIKFSGRLSRLINFELIWEFADQTTI
jgi:hypothetical protein